MGAPRTLPRTEADDIASMLPDPTSSHMGARLSTSHTLQPADAGFEGEDLELQAALQASLTGPDQLRYAALEQSSSAARPTSSLPMPPSGRTAFPGIQPDPLHDPVATSMARNKAIMQRMQQQQEMVLREGYDEEVATGFGNINGVEMRRSGESSHQQEAQTTDEMEEEEAIRRAIEESRTDGSSTGIDRESMDVVNNDAEWRPGQLQHMPPSLPTASGDRVYDDEDSQLQAALKASLEGLPEGFVVPPTPPRGDQSKSATAQSIPAEAQANEPEEEEENPTVEIDAEEMRRRRLARFAG